MAQLLTLTSAAADVDLEERGRNGTCPSCRGSALERFLELDSMPVFNNVLYPDRASAREAPTAPIELVICHDCGLIANAAFDETRVEYSPAYENSLHGSGVFGEWVQGLAERLAKDFNLPGGRVLEVGAGSGEFLSILCEAAGCVGVGFDPSHDPDDQRAGEGRMHVATGMGGAEETADLVVCRHVLEHVADPVALLRNIADRTKASAPGGRVPIYLEVPDASYMITQDAFWDVIYEHPLYFDQQALRSTFARAGYETTGTGQTFGGQFAYIEGFTDGAVDTSRRPDRELAGLVEAARGFGTRFSQAIDRQAAMLDDVSDRGPVVIWGAGSKGVTYCNLVPRANNALVIDVNDKKTGMRLPVTGQSVLPPQALVDMDVSLVVVMNGNYADEIRSTLRGIGVRAPVTVA